jgi:2-dehydro-3-deoxyphosphooctonate aldolase (KDO 8-P synthase)
MRVIKVRGIPVGGKNPLVLIAGPCVIENEEITLTTASKIKEITQKVGMPFIFKSSYKKDNRSSPTSYMGPGIDKGLKILIKVREELDIPILSDVHSAEEAKIAGEVLDVIQIPAFLSQQTSLAFACGKTGKPINVKKGQFVAPEDMKSVIKKIEYTGNKNILLTERGTVFGYHRLVVDMRSLSIMRSLGYPVVFDVTHSLRIYGISSLSPKGGEPQFIEPLARAGVAAGCDAVFIETHPDPRKALVDAASMLPLSKLESLLMMLKKINNLVRDKTGSEY